MKTAVVDCETDGLDYTKVHCIVSYVIEEDKYYFFLPRKFRPTEYPKWLRDNPKYVVKEMYEFAEWSKEPDLWVMHNGIAFDMKVFEDLLGVKVPLSKVVDTLIYSRLLSVERSKHSVESYGEQFKFPKPSHEDWSVFSWDMLWRCLKDTQIQTKIYGWLNNKLIKKKGSLDWGPLHLEQAAQKIMLQQTENGFYLDYGRARALQADLEDEHQRLTEEIRSIFPTKAKFVAEKHPRQKKDGSWYSVDLRLIEAMADDLMRQGCYDLAEDMLGGPYSQIEFQEFNLNSAPQRVERLQEIGWEPIEFTPAGNPKFTEESVRLLGDKLPKQAQLLGRYLMVQSRLSTVNSWLELRDPQGYVHGKIITIGARTHRMAHQNPNMGNIPKVKTDENKAILTGLKGRYGYECRSCWSIDPTHEGFVLLGCDASGIQLRALAHYAGDKEYIHQVCEGDVHAVHADILGCDRDTAKTFIYAWLLNAGHAKLGAILGGNRNDGRDANARFVDRMPFLGNVKRTFEGYGETSDFVALDGRRIYIPSAHLALSTGLQSFEAIVMKWVLRAYHLDFKQQGFPFWQRNLVHDEFQIELPEDRAHYAGDKLVHLFGVAGKTLGSRCPLTGEYKIGYNWAETH